MHLFLNDNDQSQNNQKQNLLLRGYSVWPQWGTLELDETGRTDRQGFHSPNVRRKISGTASLQRQKLQSAQTSRSPTRHRQP